jgi:hypothetical protein
MSGFIDHENIEEMKDHDNHEDNKYTANLREPLNLEEH